MEYVTTKQASERWNLSIREVQRILKAGGVEGAVKMNKVWMIPINAKKPSKHYTKEIAMRKEKLKQEKNMHPTTDSNEFYFPGLFITGNLPLSAGELTIEEPLFEQFRLEKLYRSSQYEEVEKLFSFPQLDDPLFFCKCFHYMIASIMSGSNKTFDSFMIEMINLQYNDHEEIRRYSQLIVSLLAGGMGFPELVADFVKEGDFSHLPKECRILAIYIRTRYFLSIKDYYSMLAVASTALMAIDEEPTILHIYLSLAAAIGANHLEKKDVMEKYLQQAVDYALPYQIYSPFIEQGLYFGKSLKRIIKNKDEKAYHIIYSKMIPCEENWNRIHKAYTHNRILQMLTPEEYRVIIQVLDNVELSVIAKDIGLSEGKTKQFIKSIYTKLGFKGKVELKKIGLVSN